MMRKDAEKIREIGAVETRSVSELGSRHEGILKWGEGRRSRHNEEGME